MGNSSPTTRVGVSLPENYEGAILDEWEDDPKLDCRGPEYCGGCNRCMEMQAIHAGFKVEVLKVGGIIDRLLP